MPINFIFIVHYPYNQQQLVVANMDSYSLTLLSYTSKSLVVQSNRDINNGSTVRCYDWEFGTCF